MPSPLSQLMQTLDLEMIEQNLFRGRSPNVGWQRIFGGLVISQALAAASRTVDEERDVHSLHAYFLRPGDPSIPIIYDVDRIRDGGSFTTRRVRAIQHGHAIYSMSASFQLREEGLEHFIEMPDVPGPDDLPSARELARLHAAHAPEIVRRYWESERAIEIRPVDVRHYMSSERLEPRQHVWFRSNGELPADYRTWAATLAYASDMTLLDTSLFPHGLSMFDPRLQGASLDHAIWFHRRSDITGWHLYSQDSPNASGGRGFNRGSIYTRDGRLVASVAQEGLIRLRRNA